MDSLKIDFLVATINRTNCEFLYPIFKNIDLNDCNVIVINQCIDIAVPLNGISTFHDNIHLISVPDKGTSNSRNLAMLHMKGDIGVFLDDDVVLEHDSMIRIANAYIEHKDADIITFQSQYFSGKYFKSYSDNSFKHNKYTLKNISDIEITFRKTIIEKKVLFNTLFGLGAKFPLGEYLIFLTDCYNAESNMYYVPGVIVKHPDCLHSGIQFIQNYEEGRGALFACLSKYLFPFMIFYFAIRKYSMYKNKHSFWREVYFMFKGAIKYFLC